MATVEVTFTPLPAHVRTARLVATAVARRSGVAESLLDEVRLAVGEACSRAVEAHQLHCPAEPVRIALTDQAGRFEIEVVNTSQAPAGSAQAGPGSAARPGPTAAGVPADAADSALGPPGFSLAVIAGLADDVQISETAAGTSIRMSWPSSGPVVSGSPA
ncbi:MAG TPA: ATP-binding protein [Streptosporangiaceae bacterium]|nr:ATP-binding protein [Streptosporangiaceae bacterium]